MCIDVQLTFSRPNRLNQFKLLLRKRAYLLAAALLLLFNSCTNKVADTGEYSPKFKPVYDTVTLYNTTWKNPRRAIQYLDSTYRYVKDPFIADRFRYYAFHFLYNRKELKDPKTAIIYADSMIMMAKKSITQKQYEVQYAEASFATGDAYADLQQYGDAYKFFYQGYYIGKNTLDDAILAEYTYRMGMMLFKQGHYREAANYFKLSYKQSFAYRDDFRAFYQRQELLDNIGESYKNSGDIDSAKLYFQKTLDFIDMNSRRYGSDPEKLNIARGVVYGNMGDLAFNINDYPRAEQLLKKSIAINLRPHNDNSDAQLTEIKLARLYLKNNRINDLFKILQALRNQLDTLKNEEAETNWNKLMSSYYIHQNDNQNALYYLKNYSALKDSLAKRTLSLKRTDINQQQASLDKQDQIENLRDHNTLQLIYIYLAVLFSVMAVIIIFLVFRNLKRSKQDVIAVKKLNDQIRMQQKELENTLEELNEGSREKDRILRAVAHDLRNPLGGIASLSTAMADPGNTEEQKNLINLVRDTSFNSLELINEILEAANTATSTFNKEWVEINSLVSNSIELLRFKAAEKKQEIILLPLLTPAELYINREKIWRVMSNLISNAIKFSPKGSVINVRVTSNGDGIEICVEDHGIGIPNGLQKQVFNMFTDARRSGTDGEKSFGLGLSICRQIVEKHNGKIWLKSDENKGSSFHIYLPRET
ncbi:signal transduction histidine kinase [Mucilaginibacter oryzae]|uniref:histidine kinase n=1 Tax=Mucilaginibacter oryzae TaxID=468058 RepID=A0A316HVE7_9SPHI|nr:ATP-binding protein [Mucilaginibacter oryzae]PWK78922.1 signal transduction histidine kinase [Mucilaginibacter oryzae]